VTFLARGAHLRVLRERGLTLHTPAGESLIPVRAEEDPAHVGPVDVVMLAVKTYHLPSALPLMDLEQGRPLEVEALLGSVVRRGRAAGVPTPVLATLHGVLAPHAQGRTA